MRYNRAMTISGKGAAPEQFATMLRGVCVDSTGLVYAVGDRAVKVFDSAGKLVRQWAISRPAYCIAIQGEEKGSGTFSRNGPEGAAQKRVQTPFPPAALTVWVGESGQIERFDAQGQPREPFRDGDRLGTVTAVGFCDENILVADATARCIRRYDRSGKWLNDIGKDNNTQGFLIPNGVLDFRVDAAGVIHAANPAKHRIERYSIKGELLGHFGKFGMQRPEDFGGCCNPTNIALLPGGTVVTEKAPPRLKVFDQQGTVAAMVGPESFDALCKNMGLAVDGQRRIYVIDTERLCIQVFAPEGNVTSTPGLQGSAPVGTAPGSQSPALKDAGGGR